MRKQHADGPWSQGRVAQWDAAKGLGFIAPAGGGARVLLRRADLTGRLRTRQPQVGEPVRFSLHGEGAQRRASRVNTLLPLHVAPAPPAAASAAQSRSARLLVIPAFAAVLAGIHTAWPLPRPVPLLYGALSAALLVVYGLDRWAARRSGQAGVPHAVLHGLALMGGWPGALLGQHIFRHKVSDPIFLRRTWAMVCVNLLLLLVVCTPLLTPRVGR